MYSRQSNRFPGWLFALAAILLVFGGYYVWQGFIAFMATNGNITAPATATAFHQSLDQTATVGALGITDDAPGAVQLVLSPTMACQAFKVKVVKARIRECPKDTCNTLDFPAQGAIICVYGTATEASDWYEININPTGPVIELGYMHQSVIGPANPTARPSATLNLPTVTPIPATVRKPTLTPLPATSTPFPSATNTPMSTPTPTVTPVPSATTKPSSTPPPTNTPNSPTTTAMPSA